MSDRDRLRTHHAKRDFERTAEPRGEAEAAAPARALTYVIQRHAASRLHFDFRLELDGVLKSWAVPKGPSLSPSDKRLAVEVEDHPFDYGGFEGSIPHGEYGGGYVLLWDKGTWTPEGDPHAGLAKGRLKFTLDGERLHGGFTLVRLRDDEKSKKHNWLLMKSKDVDARTGKAADVTSTPPMPKLESLAPELATLEAKLPSGEGWSYELKLDGYRALASVEAGKARLVSRNQKDWSSRFAKIADALAKLKVGSAVFDGEVCAVDADGRTRFQDLQNALSLGDSANLVYFIFDLLLVDGYDLREKPLRVRQAILASILDGVTHPLAKVSAIGDAKEAEKVLREACRCGLEGLVAKRLDAPYREGRGNAWLKVKCKNEQELVIAGYTAPRGSRTGIGALLLGVKKEGHLRYAGKVGTGVSERVRLDLVKRLDELRIEKPAVEGAPRMKDATWVTPKLVCQVAFGEWTKDGHLRHPSFVGMREDKAASEVTREAPEPARVSRTSHTPRGDQKPRIGRVAISHPTRVLDPSSGITKLDLARYQETVASLMLPYATKRPLALVRCPNEIGKHCFFQKKKYPGMPDAVKAAKAGGNDVLYVESEEGLVSLVQFGGVEIHGWGSRLPHAEKPDWIVIDLDPDEALPFARVVTAATEVREIFRSIGLESFVKTTGGKGLHVVAPIVPRFSWTVVKTLAHSIATRLERTDRARFTSNMAKKARPGKIFVDYLRNGEGATAILPYSARSREGLPVAMPVAWADLRHVDPRELTLKTVPALLRRRKKDPWRELLSLKQPLPAALVDLVPAEAGEGSEDA